MGCTSKLVACAKWRGNATILLGASIQLLTHFDGGSLYSDWTSSSPSRSLPSRYLMLLLKPRSISSCIAASDPCDYCTNISCTDPNIYIYKHVNTILARSGNKFQHSTQHRWEFRPYYPPQPQEDLTEGKNERWIKASVKLSYFHSPEKGPNRDVSTFCWADLVTPSKHKI